jgi:hypothetical protein
LTLEVAGDAKIPARGGPISSVTHGIIWLTRPTWYLVRWTLKILALADILMLRATRRAQMSIPEKSQWKTRLVEREFPDRSFDIEFWQEQGDEAIFAAAWELVELAEEVSHGRKPTLQRTATTLKRI